LVTGWLRRLAFFATCILRLELPFTRRHRADKMTEVATTEPMTTGSNNCLRDANHTIEDSAVETTPDAEAAALPPNVPPAAEANAGDANIQADSWRVEVAARLERYRTRRKPRSPRYPSLMLPFDAPESWSRPTAVVYRGRWRRTRRSPLAISRSQPMQRQRKIQSRISQDLTSPDLAKCRSPGQSLDRRGIRSHRSNLARSSNFRVPRPFPFFHTSDLADPFLIGRDRELWKLQRFCRRRRARGMLIEPADREGGDKLLGAESLFPSKAASASIGRRALAALWMARFWPRLSPGSPRFFSA